MMYGWRGLGQHRTLTEPTDTSGRVLAAQELMDSVLPTRLQVGLNRPLTTADDTASSRDAAAQALMDAAAGSVASIPAATTTGGFALVQGWSLNSSVADTTAYIQAMTPAQRAAFRSALMTTIAAPITNSADLVTQQKAQAALNLLDSLYPPASSSWFTASMFGGIPNWGLVACAGLALFLFSGGQRGK